MEKEHIDLNDLLILREFSGYSPARFLRHFTDWAELRLSEGKVSDSLLILASLGLDKQLSRNEVYQYFDAYHF